ncbi:hypothetical protein BDZ91DRAFT_702867 [Kalaharituber pfeilii]|nr:hypothetical protein BDZ91DRAFT_702867 [Kalaharituber pfeilii]
MSDRRILITSAEGQTGHLAAELLLTDEEFRSKYSGIVLVCANPAKCEDLKTSYGATVEVVNYEKDSSDVLAKKMKDSGANAVYLIPPATSNKLSIVKKLIEATKKASVPNVLFLSSAGCDLATEEKQPRLREFIEMEKLLMECKGDTSTATGHTSVIIRAGFYAENLLLYNKNAQDAGLLPLPIGKNHEFAPLALGDLAHLAGVILTSAGPQGFADEFRGQLITLTGPQLVSGEELAETASQSLGTKMDFAELSDTEAREILDAQTDIDDAEKEYLLEYYSLVREGKTNYVSNLAFKQATGALPTFPSEFFETYEDEFKPKKRKTGKAKVGEGHSGNEKGNKSGTSNREKNTGRKGKK